MRELELVGEWWPRIHQLIVSLCFCCLCNLPSGSETLIEFNKILVCVHQNHINNSCTGPSYIGRRWRIYIQSQNPNIADKQRMSIPLVYIYRNRGRHQNKAKLSPIALVCLPWPTSKCFHLIISWLLINSNNTNYHNRKFYN